jgi:endoglucanase
MISLADRSKHSVVLLLVLTVTCPPARAANLPPLHVAGNRVVDSQSRRVRLRGVNAASLEWSSTGEGHILETVRVATRDWHATIVRLPLSQDRWFGKAPEQKDDGAAYRALVKQAVGACNAGGAYALLDLHWSDAGEWGKLIGQHKLPDANSIAFWKSCAADCKNQPGVLFDLYNEPHDVTWEQWRNGGMVTERDRRSGAETTYLAVGMQAMLDAVRSTGARNVVVVGGLDWSYDLSGVLADGPLRDAGGNGIIYANHAYPFKGETVDKWIGRMEKATQRLPVIVSEFGSDPKGGAGETGEQWIKDVLKAIHDHDWDFAAWDLHPSAGPDLVIDWSYTPTLHFGKLVKEELAAAPK